MKKFSKAVVTGGAGFIGSHLVDELIRRDVETVVIDNLSTGSMTNLSQHHNERSLHVIRGDIKNIDRLLRGEDGIDIVFHEAAIASVPKSVSEPMLVHDVNVTSSLHVLNFCLNKNVRRFVFASSAAVYGLVEQPPASEEHLCRPCSPYGATKLAVENYLGAYHQTYGLETVALRYFNVYGLRQGFSDYAGVITIFVNQLLQGKRPTIFGDGKQSRDFVHVRDIVQAKMLSMESRAAIGETFNVASGESTTILRLLKLLGEILGAPSPQPEFAPARRGDTRTGAALITKIGTLLGYKPRVQLREGLTELVQSARRTPQEPFVYARNEIR